MDVILYLILAWLICWLVGFGIVGLVLRDQSKAFRGVVAVSGYALSQLIFFVVFILGAGPQFATVAVFAVAVILGGLYLIKSGMSAVLISVSSGFKKSFKLHAVLLMAVIMLAGLPYVTAGLGNYWHSAGEDAIDGLNGRSVFLAEGSDSLVAIQKTIASDELARLLKSGYQKRLKQEVGVELNDHIVLQDYLTEYGRLQYSSLAFWSKSLGMPVGVDAFLFQALLNLLLMGVGVYILGRETFDQPKGIALSASLLATLGHFYLATFVNGHIGSLMYGAMAPFFLYFCLRWIDEKWRVGIWLILPLLWLAFMSLCYPYPLLYLIAPLVLYAGYCYLYKKPMLEGRGRLISLAQSYSPWILAVVVLIGFVVAWWLFQPIRARSDLMFRSWGSIFGHVGFLQFWGLWPSNLTNLTSMLGWLDQVLWLKAVSLTLAISLTLITIYGFYRIVKSGSAFMAIWLGIWLVFFVMMRFVVVDSYYLYKFLYINAFMMAIALMVGMYVIWCDAASALVRNSSIGIFVVFLLANVSNNVYSSYALSEKPYNKDYSAYRNILAIHREMLAQTYIDVPNLDHKDVLRQTILASGAEIQTDKSRARYLLRIDGMNDIISGSSSAPIWQKGTLKLFAAPEHDLLNLASYWPPSEVQDGTPQAGSTFRWMTGGPKGKFMVDVISPSDDAKYLVFCGASGPSVDYQPIKIDWSDGAGAAASFVLGSYGCHWLEVVGKVGPYVFSSDVAGREVSAVDSRKMTYRVYRIALSKEKYDTATLRTMISTQPDIISENVLYSGSKVDKTLLAGQLVLGGGWFPPEKFGRDFFRWGDNESEIYIHNPRAAGNLMVDIEPGPSVGSLPMKLKVVDDAGNVLNSFLISSRQEIQVSLPLADQTKRVRLVAESAELSVPSDPRHLNYRVFKIRWVSDFRQRISKGMQ